MIVVGGTYLERCANPPFETLRGSALRAAASLRDRVPVTLVSAMDEENRAAAEAITGGLKINTEWHVRTEPVRFFYFTPLSAPTIDGRLSRIEKSIHAEDDVVLRFGMIESADIHIKCKTLVVDPQQPRESIGLDLTGMQSERMALVANALETRVMAKELDTEIAARTLLKAFEAEVVVTKLGARGALVTTPSDQTAVGPFPTSAVWPIGTGDIFAAAFAHAWGSLSQAPEDAARYASRATSELSREREQERPLPDKFDDSVSELAPVSGELVVYLAGPFFDLPQRWLIQLLRDAMRDLGATPFSPFHDVGVGGTEVAQLDLKGLDRSKAILACLDASDAGTLIEIGYAISKAIPHLGYGELIDKSAGKMIKGTGGELHSDLSTALYRSIWAAMGMPLAP